MKHIMTRLAPVLACLGLLVAWQLGSLALANDSFPTAWESLRAIPAILTDKESLLNIADSLRR
ncbi:MAG: ABC transporter permease, partial [Bradyrhizobium sp.]|nr:ABC transporter permease [Bradyrhizobium sp.]